MSAANGVRAGSTLAAAMLAACGGAPSQAVDGGDATIAADAAMLPDGDSTAFPRDVPDDVTPYELAADCDALVTWTLPPVLAHLARVAAAGRSEAWVIADHVPTPDAGGTLVHLAADGSVIDTGWRGIHDVWMCGDETWAAGRGGTLIHRAGGGAFAPVPLPIDADLLSGFGCAGELWLAAGDHVLVLGGDEMRTIAIESEFAHVPLRMHGAGPIRVATEYYGSILEYDPAAGVFLFAGSTDDIITDAFVRRDGTGISLHGGYGLVFDPAEPIMHQMVDGLLAYRVSRRADDDAWFVGGTTATHLTAQGFEVIAMGGSYGQDVDARADVVWAVGFDGAAALTGAGFCPVAH